MPPYPLACFPGFPSRGWESLPTQAHTEAAPLTRFLSTRSSMPASARWSQAPSRNPNHGCFSLVLLSVVSCLWPASSLVTAALHSQVKTQLLLWASAGHGDPAFCDPVFTAHPCPLPLHGLCAVPSDWNALPAFASVVVLHPSDLSSSSAFSWKGLFTL